MATASKTYDVFISNAASDREVAGEVAEYLATAGLETFHASLVPSGKDVGDAIWQALAECRALIVIISPETPTPAMGIVEIGAARVWNKPIYLLINGPSSTRLPVELSGYPVFPLSRLDDVVQMIRTGFEPLSERERDLLANIYQRAGVPADQLSQSPDALRQLTQGFNKEAQRKYSGERLLSEIMRMRKQGYLPRLRA